MLEYLSKSSEIKFIMLNVSLFVNNRFTILLITSIFDFKPYFVLHVRFVYISVYSFTNVWFGRDTEYSLTLTETDDISTGMIMVYGSQCLQAGLRGYKSL